MLFVCLHSSGGWSGPYWSRGMVSTRGSEVQRDQYAVAECTTKMGKSSCAWSQARLYMSNSCYDQARCLDYEFSVLEPLTFKMLTSCSWSVE